MDLNCDFCKPKDPKKPVIDFEFTHLGRTARFVACAECAGFNLEDQIAGADIASIIYKLDDKVREQEEALRAAKPDTK